MRSRPLLFCVVGLALALGLGVLSPYGQTLLASRAQAAATAEPAADPEGDAGADPAAGSGRAPDRGPSPDPSGTPTDVPAVEEAPASPEASPAATPQLLERLAAVLADPALPADGRVAVSILDRDGRIVLDQHADAALLPASTQKVVVAAAALAAFGPGHRYRTTVAASAPPASDGSVLGDLVLVGGGDPALASPTFIREVMPERPHTPLAVLADQIVAAGITHVTGGVYGDPRAFTDEPLPLGWRESYLEDLDGTLVSGLTVDGGRRLLYRNGGLQGVAAPDPAAEAAAALHTLLVERGVVIDGSAGSSRTPPPAAVPLAAVESPAMLDLLRWMMQRSDNSFAETIFRSVGAAAGDASWSGSAAAVRRALASLQLDWSAAVLADGSGLSRKDRMSPALLTGIDVRMTRSNLGAEWQSLMAVSGESGTLRRRLLGTVAEQRLRGKTGSLRDVRSLTGLVLGPAGTGYHFAVIANGLDDDAKAAVRAMQDELVLVLAEDLYGCVRLPVPQPPPPDGAPDQAQGGAPEPAAASAPPEPQYELRCAA